MSSQSTAFFDELGKIKTSAKSDEFTVVPKSWWAGRKASAEAYDNRKKSFANIPGYVKDVAKGGVIGAGLGTAVGHGIDHALVAKGLHFLPVNAMLVGGGIGALEGAGWGVYHNQNKAYERAGVKRTMLSLGRGRFTEAAAKKYLYPHEKKAAVSGEVLPPGAHVVPRELVPWSPPKYSRIPVSMAERIRQAGKHVVGGWRAVGNIERSASWPAPTLGERVFSATRLSRLAIANKLLNNTLEGRRHGALHLPLAYRVGGAARLLGPRAAVLAATGIPAAYLLTRKTKKGKK